LTTACLATSKRLDRRLNLLTMTWREYHQSTKNSAESLRRAPHVLDWANMPDPFRHYDSVPVLDLPADPPIPETPALDLLEGDVPDGVAGDAKRHSNWRATTPAANGPAFLSQLLFNSAAISSSKRILSTGYRYALSVNPSSGNLHPTEFHFFTRGLKDWTDGLYHHHPSSHMAEQRALGHLEMKLAGSSAPIVFVFAGIAWREAWKCRDRAYRYCLYDIGHAWQALALAARAMGCDTFATGHFPDDEVAQFWPSASRLCIFRRIFLPRRLARRERIWHLVRAVPAGELLFARNDSRYPFQRKCSVVTKCKCGSDPAGEP